MNNASVQTRQQRRYRARQERKGPAAPQKNAFYRAMDMAKKCAEAMKASMNLGPILLKIAMMDLAMRLGQYKSRGHGRGTPSRNYLRPTNSRKPHQSGQECLRRAVGGWAFRKRCTGLTKNETLHFIVGAGRMRLETAIETVRGLDRPLSKAVFS